MLLATVFLLGVILGWVLGEIARLLLGYNCVECDGWGHEGGCETCGKRSRIWKQMWRQ